MKLEDYTEKADWFESDARVVSEVVAKGFIDGLTEENERLKSRGIEGMYFEIAELKAENERLKSDVQFFVDRVESGVARSKTTYVRFKETLEAINK